jgi:hypothetical protein
MAQIASHPTGEDRQHWPETTRQLARDLARRDGLSVADTRRRLESEHGLTVPASTLGHWLRQGPPDAVDPASLRDRIYRLAARELASLEKQRKGKADLRRLEAIGRILKTAETDRPNRQQAKGLARFADLSERDDSDGTDPEPSDVETSPSREP